MGISGTIDGQSESAAYTYDNVGRLVTSSQTTNGASAQRRFAYDRWGNRTGVWNAVTGGTQIQSVSLVESSSIPNNQIESVTENSATVNYTYDAAGNVTDDDVNTFVYDAENRLVSINSGAEQYKYDHQNRRVAKTVGSVTTQYVWEGSQVIAEHAASTGNVLVDYVFLGGRMVKKVEGSTTRYIVSDRLSARMMLDEDYDVAGKQSHLPFGEAMATSGEQDKHRFTSYERDSGTDTDYAINRQYAQGAGRFMRVDPKPLNMKNPMALGSYGDPQSLNRYSYVRNDPIQFADPLGLAICFGYHVWIDTVNEEGDINGTFYVGFVPLFCEEGGEREDTNNENSSVPTYEACAGELESQLKNKGYSNFATPDVSQYNMAKNAAMSSGANLALLLVRACRINRFSVQILCAAIRPSTSYGPFLELCDTL